MRLSRIPQQVSNSLAPLKSSFTCAQGQHFRVFCWLLVTMIVIEGGATLKNLCRLMPHSLAYWTALHAAATSQRSDSLGRRLDNQRTHGQETTARTQDAHQPIRSLFVRTSNGHPERAMGVISSSGRRRSRQPQDQRTSKYSLPRNARRFCPAFLGARGNCRSRCRICR